MLTSGNYYYTNDNLYFDNKDLMVMPKNQHCDAGFKENLIKALRSLALHLYKLF